MADGLLDPNSPLGAATNDDADSNVVGTLPPASEVEMTFDDVVAKLNEKATAAIKNGADRDKIEKQLDQKLQAASSIWQQYGSAPFSSLTAPKSDIKPVKEDLAAAKPATAQLDPLAFNNVQAGSSSAASEDNVPDFAGNVENKLAPLYKGGTSALGEAAGNLGTGFLASVPAGLMGIARGTAGPVAEAMSAEGGVPYTAPTTNLSDVVDEINKTQDSLTYKPETEEGKAAAETAQLPFEYLQKAGRYAGEKVQDVTGSPALAAATETGVQFLPGLFGARGKGLPKDIGLDALKEKELPKTGDPDIDAGISAGGKIAENPTPEAATTTTTTTTTTAVSDTAIDKPRFKVPAEDVPTSQAAEPAAFDKGEWDKALEQSKSEDRDTAAAGMDKLEEIEKTLPQEQRDALYNPPSEEVKAKPFSTAEMASPDPLVHEDLTTKLDAGELTTGHILDALADNHGDLQNPIASNFGKLIRAAGNKLGGLDVPVERFDPSNPEHVEIYNNAPKVSNIEGLYDPKTNKVIVFGDNPSMGTMAHEAVHAITHKALELGRNNMLDGVQRTAYQTLRNLFDTLKPQLDKAAGTDINKSYGATDLHEFVSELYTNDKFRDHLKSMDLSDASAKSLGGLGRSILGKVRNAYEATTKTIRTMLGLSPKADTALDAMTSASHDFLHSLNGEDVKNAKNPSEVLKAKLGAPKDERESYEANLSPRQAVRSIKESALGNVALGKGIAAQLGTEVTKAATKEGAPNVAIEHYRQNPGSTALANYPQTKAAMDRFSDLSKQAATRILNTVPTNASPRQLGIMQSIAHNIGTYLTEFYRGTDYSKDVMDTAARADKILNAGGSLSTKQLEAHTIMSNMKNWVNQNLIPTGNLTSRTMSTLHNMGDALDVNTEKVARDVAAANPDLKGTQLAAAQKAAIGTALQQATPTGAGLAKLTNRLIADIGGLNGEFNKLSQKYAGIRVGDLFTEKTNVPKEISDYMGRVDDMGARVTATLAKQYAGIAHLTGLKNLADAGKAGGWMWDRKVDAPTNAVQITGENAGEMQDKYVSPKVADLINKQLELNKNTKSMLSQLFNSDNLAETGSMMAQSLFKTGRTGFRTFKTFRQATGIKNYVMWGMGSIGRIISNGNINPSALARGIFDTVKELGGTKLSLVDAGGNLTDTGRMVRAGLAGTDTLTKIGDEFRQQRMGNDLEKDLIATAPSKQLAKWALNKLPALLYATDHWATKANFLDRASQLKGYYDRIGVTKTLEEIDREAADQMKNTNFDPARVPNPFRLMEQTGMSISLPYVVEAHRNVLNGGLLGFQDLARGAKSGDAIMMANGAKRMIATIGAVAGMNYLYSALGNTIASIVGLTSNQVKEDDKRTPYLQDAGSRFRSGQATEVSDAGTKASDPLNSYMWDPGGAWDPYYASNQPLHIAADILQHHGDPGYDTQKQLGRAMEEYTGIMFSNPATKALLGVAEGNTPALKYRATDAYNKELSGLMEYMSEDNANRLMNLQEMITPQSVKDAQMAKDASPRMKLMAQLGWGLTKISKTGDIESYEAAKFKNAMETARKPLENIVTNPEVFSPTVVERQYKQALKGAAEAEVRLGDVANFAKGSGLSEDDVIEKMNLASPKYDKHAIPIGAGDEMPAAILLYRNLEGRIKQLVKEAPPDEQEALTEKYTAKLSLLNDLTQKYQDLTLDQIKELR